MRETYHYSWEALRAFQSSFHSSLIKLQRPGLPDLAISQSCIPNHYLNLGCSTRKEPSSHPGLLAPPPWTASGLGLREMVDEYASYGILQQDFSLSSPLMVLPVTHMSSRYHNTESRESRQEWFVSMDMHPMVGEDNN